MVAKDSGQSYLAGLDKRREKTHFLSEDGCRSSSDTSEPSESFLVPGPGQACWRL